MSLVPFKEGSVILDDPMSRSLVIVHPSNGSLKFFEQVYDSKTAESAPSWSSKNRPAIASYVCPQCGTEFSPNVNVSSSINEKNAEQEQGTNILPNVRPIGSRRDLPRTYFKLLESSHRHYSLEQQSQPALGPEHKYFIPESLFIPGYFRKFFKTLSLLGNGARGSVYKVVHRIGDIDLGIFALKKIPIGNDMVWFQKCIREVKALSSLTHRSVNLITYNHVWLEMNTACGLLRTIDGRGPEALEDIPCIFILQQFCSGGNLEDFILRDVFQKFQDLQSSEERKKRFLYRRKHPNERLGLSTLQITSILKDIATGLQELHDIGLIHRDLKPSNCLLLEENCEKSSVQNYMPTIVIGDLGECQMDGESRTATGATGTLEFTAPEVIIPGTTNSKPTNYNEYTFASDMYSLGMICYFIVFGELPFESRLEIRELKQDILEFTMDKSALIKMHNERSLNPIDDRIFDLMELLLSQNVGERLTGSEVISFIEDMTGPTVQKEAEGERKANDLGEEEKEEIRSNEIEFVQEAVLPRSEDEVLEVSSSQADDQRQEAFSNQGKVSSRKRILCLLINSALAALVISFSAEVSALCYVTLVLLGVSLKSSLKDQKWLMAIMTTFAIYQALPRFH